MKLGTLETWTRAGHASLLGNWLGLALAWRWLGYPSPLLTSSSVCHFLRTERESVIYIKKKNSPLRVTKPVEQLIHVAAPLYPTFTSLILVALPLTPEPLGDPWWRKSSSNNPPLLPADLLAPKSLWRAQYGLSPSLAPRHRRHYNCVQTAGLLKLPASPIFDITLLHSSTHLHISHIYKRTHYQNHPKNF